MAKIIRRLDTPEARAFWANVETITALVASWPDWKRAGINTLQIRPEPRPVPYKTPQTVDK